MRKLIVSTWMTQDNVFDATTMADWFNPYDSEARQNYIKEGILACDAILFGRKTYEMLAPYWSSLKNNEMGVADKLNSVAKYVVSTTLEKADWQNSTIISDNVLEEIAKLKQQPGTEIQIEGSGMLVQFLLQAGLIDELRLLIHPVIAGKGRRFFDENTPLVHMELIRTQALDKGVTLMCYKPLEK